MPDGMTRVHIPCCYLERHTDEDLAAGRPYVEIGEDEYRDYQEHLANRADWDDFIRGLTAEFEAAKAAGPVEAST